MEDDTQKPYVPKMDSNDFLVQTVKGDFELCKVVLKKVTIELSEMEVNYNNQSFKQMSLLKNELALKIKEHESNHKTH